MKKKDRKPQLIAYLRVSDGDKQTVEAQRHELLEWAQTKGVQIDRFIDVEMSSKKGSAERRINELISSVHEGDTVVCSELSRIARSTLEVLGLIHTLTEAGIRFVAIKQNLDLDPHRKNDPTSKVLITVYSLLAELERDLLGMRTKNGLSLAKSRGVILGRKRGSISKSILDGKQDQILELLDKKIPKSSIAKILGVSRSCVVNFIESRNLKPKP